MDKTHLITLIDTLLPQTQCTKCTYQGCQPYAEAIAEGEAINKCPPGGEETIKALAALLDTPVKALEVTEASPPQLAFIREAECIGCTKCIQACPVDAIVGAAKLMHTILEAECTGCELCVVPCPVDCIEMRSLLKELTPLTGDSAHTEAQRVARQLKRDHARIRFEFHNQRLARLEREKQQQRLARLQKVTNPATIEPLDNRQGLIEKIKAQNTTVKNQLTAEQKRLKIEAAMTQVTLKKVEKQLQQYNTPELQQQVATLRTKVAELQQALKDSLL